LKNKVVAGLLAIFVGGLGIHKFYLGKVGQGILYLLFSGQEYRALLLSLKEFYI
jgi:TM2 domain-containing membrane protein YozV